jgi:transportin-1
VKDAVAASAAHASSSSSSSGGGADAGDEDGNASEDEEELDFEDEDAADWSLRKCAAASLDQMALVFHERLLVVLLPCLQQTLTSPDWLVRESGILALGAVAEGAYKGLASHLPQLLPYLLKMLVDPKPLVRSITCWTVSRYATWIMIDPVRFILFSFYDFVFVVVVAFLQLLLLLADAHLVVNCSG